LRGRHSASLVLITARLPLPIRLMDPSASAWLVLPTFLTSTLIRPSQTAPAAPKVNFFVIDDANIDLGIAHSLEACHMSRVPCRYKFRASGNTGLWHAPVDVSHHDSHSAAHNFQALTLRAAVQYRAQPVPRTRRRSTLAVLRSKAACVCRGRREALETVSTAPHAQLPHTRRGWDPGSALRALC
jgi:hypothetical protein